MEKDNFVMRFQVEKKETPKKAELSREQMVKEIMESLRELPEKKAWEVFITALTETIADMTKDKNVGV